MVRYRCLPAFLLSVAALPLLVACASGPPKPAIIQANIAVASDVNPDARGRASPIVLRLFELKNLGAFQNADFFSLLERDKEALGGELLAREEFTLRPGENKHFDRPLQAETRYVAVIAAFRDLEKSSWRAAVPVRVSQSMPVSISVRSRDVSIRAEK
ncbi:type VI secretion system protein VasD [Duganella sp. CF458]|uniref:type VI secretion system lipoprotein TssJ n=1 Tax=Duganella sp. CF458 TaxID=1884368 RepID=UPI0008ED526D|nr:type VI secretion system lipoprotein TssJ [Duganella sp. CF458]SFG09963.1 type VI secretion system protein VasD [Duganella sp. CF458]